MMSILYQYTRRPIRDAIAARHAVYDVKGAGNGAALANWLRLLNFTRNTCAHHARLWNRNFTVQVSARELAGMTDLTHIMRLSTRDQARLYPALAIICHLLATIAPNSGWPTQLAALMNTFPVDNVVQLSDMGLPRSWQSQLA